MFVDADVIVTNQSWMLSAEAAAARLGKRPGVTPQGCDRS